MLVAGMAMNASSRFAASSYSRTLGSRITSFGRQGLPRSGPGKEVAKTTLRRPISTPSIPPAALQFLKSPGFAIGVGGGLGLAGLHSATGSADDFFDYRFKSPRDPDDLASFYGGEELMELFCIFPIVGQIMMRSAKFDDTGNVITQGFPGSMKVSMVFSDDVNEDTGVTDWFNKRERFRNTCFGYTCWDMVLNFGFRTLEDGTRECYHFGEYFHGNLPVVSQIMLIAFKIQARWVAWATEHHVNHYAFAAGISDEAEEWEAESRHNMPFFLLKNYAFKDLAAMLFGYKKDIALQEMPSFLVTGGDEDEEEEEEDEDEDEDEEEKEEKKKLPFQQKAIQIQISQDIEDDKKAMKAFLAKRKETGGEDVKDLLVRRATLAQRRTLAKKGKVTDEADIAFEEDEGSDLPAKNTDVYVMAKDLAIDRARTRRMTRARTRRMTRRIQEAESSE